MQYLDFSFPGVLAFFITGPFSCFLDTLIPPALTARRKWNASKNTYRITYHITYTRREYFYPRKPLTRNHLSVFRSILYLYRHRSSHRGAAKASKFCVMADSNQPPGTMNPEIRVISSTADYIKHLTMLICILP